MLNYEHTFTKLPHPENEEITKVSCGFQHTLFLTSKLPSKQKMIIYTPVARLQTTKYSHQSL